MKLSEYLLYRDIAELGQMAELYGCDCNRNSKLELVQSIHHRLLNKSLYPSILSQFDSAYLYFLTYTLFQEGRSFSIDELMAKGKYICSQFSVDESPRTWVSELLKRGWLFPSSVKFQVQLEFPIDLHRLLKKQFADYWQLEFFSSSQIFSLNNIRDEGNSILHDLKTFLSFIQKQPIPLTVEGVIYKRQQQLAIELFHVEEKLIEEKTWRFGYGRRFPSYPNRFALLYDFCFHKEWISETSDVLAVTQKGLQVLEEERILAEETHIELLHYWVQLYKKPIPNLIFILHFLHEILEERWVVSHQLFDLVQPWLSTYYYDGPDTIFSERLIQMLIHLGLIRVAHSSAENENFFVSKNSMYTKWLSP